MKATVPSRPPLSDVDFRRARTVSAQPSTRKPSTSELFRVFQVHPGTPEARPRDPAARRHASGPHRPDDWGACCSGETVSTTFPMRGFRPGASTDSTRAKSSTASCREAGLPDPRLEEIATRFRATTFTTQINRPKLDDIDQAIVDGLSAGEGKLTSELAAVIPPSHPPAPNSPPAHSSPNLPAPAPALHAWPPNSGHTAPTTAL